MMTCVDINNFLYMDISGYAGDWDREQDTASFFDTVSNIEMFSHFTSVGSNDFDYYQDAHQLRNDEQKDKNKGAIVDRIPLDDFQFQRVLSVPYHCNMNVEKEENEQMELDVKYLNPQPQPNTDNSMSAKEKTQSRPIRKRKPRTYQYNPKSLQHKEPRSFVPDDLKNIDYWAHRKRNNTAAKKSRDARRKKEIEILSSYEIMKEEYSQTIIENTQLIARNLMLEKKVSDLKCRFDKSTLMFQ